MKKLEQDQKSTCVFEFFNKDCKSGSLTKTNCLKTQMTVFYTGTHSSSSISQFFGLILKLGVFRRGTILRPFSKVQPGMFLFFKFT